jgi:hypothetical protein
LKKNPFLLAVLALAGCSVLAGCSSVETHVDYDRGTNFSSYRTFAFKDVRTPDSPLSLKRVRAAVTRTLASRGLAEAADAKPDLWVVLHTRTHRQTQVTTYNAGWGWGWGWRGRYGNTAYIQQIPVGTLMVDLVDTKAKELVWRGSATRVIDPDDTPKEREKNMQEAVDKLFDGFPPKP